MSDDARQDRRAFFRALGRYVTAGALAFGTGLLVARPGEKCVNQGICRGCPAFEGCGLPQALSAKEHLPGQEKLMDCERPAE